MKDQSLQTKSILRKFILPGVFLLGLGTGSQIVGDSAERKLSKPALQELFNTILYHVENDYVDDTERQELFFGAIKGMLGALKDPHTRFMTPDNYRELQAETRGNFGGLGIEISIRDSVLTVVSPIEDTPAMRVGIKPGDKIVEIEKKSTREISLMDAVKKLRGTPGSTVNITVAREGEDELLYFDIVREIIKIEVVTKEFLENEKIGYIRLKQFSATSASDLERIIQDMIENKNAKGLILDLRWNPGGLLDAAHKISNFFIPEGVIVSTKGRKAQLDKVFKAVPDRAIASKIPLIILANEGSASASEIVTGAVKDLKRGKVIGTKTFGKGSVQHVIPLMHDTAIALTIQKYYTPSGESIHKKGIEPDIEVKLPDFSKDDRRNFRQIKEKKLIEEFVKANPDYNDENVKKFQDSVAKAGLDLSEYAAKRSLKDEIFKNEKRPIIDREFDTQLNRAIKELQSM